MLIVVAPSSIAICSTSAVNCGSERVASIGENSTSSQSAFACATAARARPITSSRVFCIWNSMWMSDVETNVWMRGRSESLTAFHAASMSALLARASPAITGPCTSRAIASTASKSPGEAIGKPASMTSTCRRASCWAISSFSVVFSEMPGDCSPSRSVVSKISTRLGSTSFTFLLCRLIPTDFFRCVRGYAAASALFPPRGEEKKSVGEQERHARRSLPTGGGRASPGTGSLL